MIWPGNEASAEAALFDSQIETGGTGRPGVKGSDLKGRLRGASLRVHRIESSGDVVGFVRSEVCVITTEATPRENHIEHTTAVDREAPALVHILGVEETRSGD